MNVQLHTAAKAGRRLSVSRSSAYRLGDDGELQVAEVLGNLPMLLRETRRSRHLSLRTAAEQIGMSFHTVSRIESGEDCALSNAVKILHWLAPLTRQGGKSRG